MSFGRYISLGKYIDSGNFFSKRLDRLIWLLTGVLFTEH
ncbi:hypothetical protein P378_20540 [Desulforamulus profundi]|uniref:Uncharacterized protein n=1 Tax=Desulforamulus profundi TaxID=1383067 RepID=A0A2C6MBV1_9FIRM|nr:hypothetical protein P378_20540 [Desulforamulus profundi]